MIPDKIYVPSFKPIINGVFAACEVKQSENDTEYIRKGALLEWSEEYENKIESIKALITTGKFVDTNTIRTIWKLLDSLCPQPHWKPSEEQIETLERWLLDNEFKGDSRYVYPVFESLYNDLKKL